MLNNDNDSKYAYNYTTILPSFIYFTLVFGLNACGLNGTIGLRQQSHPTLTSHLGKMRGSKLLAEKPTASSLLLVR